MLPLVLQVSLHVKQNFKKVNSKKAFVLKKTNNLKLKCTLQKAGDGDTCL